MVFFVLSRIAMLAAVMLGMSAEAPGPAPMPSPSPSPKARVPYVRFASAALDLAPKIDNEFATKRTGSTTQTIRAAAEYNFKLVGPRNRNFVALQYSRYAYQHPRSAGRSSGAACIPNSAGCVTVIGRNGSAFVPETRLSEERLDLRTSLVGIGHTYLATSSLTRRNGYGYPTLNAGFGIGFERLPDLSRPFTAYANAYYYPELGGNYVPAAGKPIRLRYKAFTYQAGLALTLARSPLFLEIGVVGDHYIGKQNAPSGVTHLGADLGFGAHV